MDDKHTFPKWMLGLAASAIILFFGFVGNSIIGYGERMSRMEEQLKSAQEDRYRKLQADADFRIRDLQIIALQSRVDRLENERRDRWRRRREENSQ